MFKTILKMLFPALTGAFQTNVAAATIGAAAIGTIGGAVNASNSDASAQSQQANSNSPWSQAQPYLESGYGQAQTALNGAMGMGTNQAYNGERTAALNPYQTQGADSTAAYANGNGTNTANQFYTSGTQMTGQGQAYGSNAQGLVNQAGVNSNQNLQSFENAGNTLAQSQTTQNMIDASNLSASRDLNETTLPSLLNQGEGQGGNDNTRTGIAMGVATSQAQQNMLANAANIQGQMFTTGMNDAQTQYNTQQTQALNANSQVGNAYGLGEQSMLNGQQANANNFNALEGAGGVYQTQNQNEDNAAQTQFQQQQTNGLGLIQQYQGIINGQYGGAPISGVGASVAGSALQGATGGAMSGAGAATLLGGYNAGYNPSYGMSGSYTSGTYAPGETSTTVNADNPNVYYDNGIN